jgi:hypothetical protein
MSPSLRLAIEPDRRRPPPVMRSEASSSSDAAGAVGRAGVAAPEQLPAPPGEASGPGEAAASDGRGQGRDVGNELQRRPLYVQEELVEQLVLLYGDEEGQGFVI